MSLPPQILLIGGHDPSGGAGLQADIETAQAHDCRAYSLVTCLTTQDSRDIRDINPLDSMVFAAQLDCLLDDVRPDAVKIGLIGSPEIGELLADRLRGFLLVIDPVLATGGGTNLADDTLISLIRERLIPQALLATPNRNEARRLANLEDAERAALHLLESGHGHILLTGADETTSGAVRNRLFGPETHTSFEHPLLPRRYHGSGCTLATACACNLAMNKPVEYAVEQALDWTWQTLRHAENPGGGQYLPNRRIAIA